jgi:HK97 gp10 family phage protein
MPEGIERLRRRLVDEIPKAVRAEMERAMIESADLIVAGARLRVAVDEGDVRDSIRHHGVREGRRGGLYVAITAGDQSTEHDGYQVARLLEFGTQKMPAQPFLLPAFRAVRRRARARMRRAVRDAILKG